MKVYIKHNGFFMTGKVSQLLDLLNQYKQKHITVKEFISTKLN